MTFFEECAQHLEASHLFEQFQKYRQAFESHSEFILIGNGGSNSTASHIAQDMTTRAGKRAFAFSDSAMLSCLVNDFGVENAYAKFLEHYSGPRTFVILISSSGESRNIVEAVRWCQSNEIHYGVLTGFSELNTVRAMSTDAVFNYYVPTNSYGVAECLHQIFLHSIVECR